MHELCASGEEYLKWIYKIQNSIGDVRSIDLAIYMGYSRASVSVAVKKLQERNYLTKDQNGFLHLTPAGLEIAENLYYRHQFLTDALVAIGVNPDVALSDACKLEHVLSEISCQKLKEYFKERRTIHG